MKEFFNFGARFILVLLFGQQSFFLQFYGEGMAFALTGALSLVVKQARHAVRVDTWLC